MVKLPKACQLKTQLFGHLGKAVRVRQTSDSFAAHEEVGTWQQSRIFLFLENEKYLASAGHVYSCVTT